MFKIRKEGEVSLKKILIWGKKQGMLEKPLLFSSRNEPENWPPRKDRNSQECVNDILNQFLQYMYINVFFKSTFQKQDDDEEGIADVSFIFYYWAQACIKNFSSFYCLLAL